MLSPKTKRNLLRILPFGVIWLIIAWVFLWTEYAVTDQQRYTPDSAIKVTLPILFFASAAIFLIGLLVGWVELIFLNQLFKYKSLAIKIASKFLIYSSGLFLLILVAFNLAAAIESNTTPFGAVTWTKYKIFISSITFLSTGVQLGFSLLISLLYAEISNHLGQNVLQNFFMGTYHKPKKETRIFMFTDMKSSTSIAEQLGHNDYFKFLRDYYNDLSDAIINNLGEVYQYIGDEVIISWTLANGIKNDYCSKCFFDMKTALENKRKAYETEFGVFPDFKAALHYGEVTTGEIGALKKEIFFTGDVLNTTARIQKLCKILQSDLVVSKVLLNHFSPNMKLKFKFSGFKNLEGKSQSIPVYYLN